MRVEGDVVGDYIYLWWLSRRAKKNPCMKHFFNETVQNTFKIDLDMM